MKTDLEELLQTRGIERLLISGVMTDVCCETTARSAFCRDYETWVISDACWSDTQEQHDKALEGLRLVTGRVYTTEQATKMLAEEQRLKLGRLKVEE